VRNFSGPNILLQQYFCLTALIISDRVTPPVLSTSGHRYVECGAGVSSRKRLIDRKRRGRGRKEEQTEGEKTRNEKEQRNMDRMDEKRQTKRGERNITTGERNKHRKGKRKK
jgi:hypothetical protein